MDIKNVYYSVFLGVANALNVTWYDLIEGDDFEIVKNACKWLDEYDEDSFNAWTDQMAMDI